MQLNRNQSIYCRVGIMERWMNSKVSGYWIIRISRK